MATFTAPKATITPSARFEKSFLGGSQRLTMRASAPVVSRQSFTIQCKESRIGKAPVNVPKGVTATLSGQTLKIKGPKGELTREFPEEIAVTMEGDVITFKKVNDNLKSRQLHGLCRCERSPTPGRGRRSGGGALPRPSPVHCSGQCGRARAWGVGRGYE